jgi:hypothetical protein
MTDRWLAVGCGSRIELGVDIIGDIADLDGLGHVHDGTHPSCMHPTGPGNHLEEALQTKAGGR